MFFSYKHFRKLTAAVTFSADAADAADAAGSYGAGRGAASAEAAAHVSAAVSAPASTLPDVVALANPVSIITSSLTSTGASNRNLRTVTELRALWPVHAMPEGIPLGPFPDMGGLENSLRQWALAQGFDVKRNRRRDAVKSRGERKEYVCWNGFKSRKCGVKVTMQRPNQHRHTCTGCKWKVICEESMEGWVCTNMVHSDHNHDLLSQDQLFVANRKMRHIPDDLKEHPPRTKAEREAHLTPLVRVDMDVAKERESFTRELSNVLQDFLTRTAAFATPATTATPSDTATASAKASANANASDNASDNASVSVANPLKKRQQQKRKQPKGSVPTTAAYKKRGKYNTRKRGANMHIAS